MKKIMFFGLICLIPISYAEDSQDTLNYSIDLINKTFIELDMTGGAFINHDPTPVFKLKKYETKKIDLECNFLPPPGNSRSYNLTMFPRAPFMHDGAYITGGLYCSTIENVNNYKESALKYKFKCFDLNNSNIPKGYAAIYCARQFNQEDHSQYTITMTENAVTIS